METFQWLKPSALWNPDAKDFARPELFVPRLLKYASDDFVEDFLADAAQPGAAALAARVLGTTSPPPKLFQPAHGVYHLVCASLCCRIPGFPDRQLRSEHQEKVSFVIRRVEDDGSESGWLADGRGWRSLGGDPQRLLSGDETRLPLLPASTADGRRLWFGYLPTASAETYKIAPKAREDTPNVPLDPRLEDELARFVTPLKGSPHSAFETITNPGQQRSVAIYLLLELAEFLGRHCKALLAILPGNAATTLPGAGQTELLRWLQQQTIGSAQYPQSLAQALRTVADHAARLNDEGGLASDDATFGDAFRLDEFVRKFDDAALSQRVSAALDPAVPPLEMPRLAPSGDERYVVRCVYERPLCARRPHTLSAASAPFRFATFFDTDAPARPIRIALPTDISPAALRKFRKGVSFMISASMQRKIAMVTGREKNLLKDEGPNTEQSVPDLAFMCSFSIQIIFIIAFFLLMIFAVVFNLIFWWLPFLRICIPIPKALLGGKK